MKRFLVTILVCAALGNPVSAQDGPKKDPPKLTPEFTLNMLLKKFDKNADGKLSKDEAAGDKLAGAFALFDKNKDGFLDKGELQPLAEKIAASKIEKLKGDDPRAEIDFDALDKDADGRLTLKELERTPLAASFKEIDANRDGRLDRREWDLFLERRKEKAKDKEKTL